MFFPTQADVSRVLDFSSFVFLADSVVQETSRISSGVFMIRYVAKDTWFKAENSQREYLMRKGDRVAIYPPAIHKDPEIFEDPLVSNLQAEV